MKEIDDSAEPVVDSHSPGMPVRLTAAGRTQLEARLAESPSETERARLERRIVDIVVVEPPADRGVVAFGATVEVHGADVRAGRFTVVGTDEADVPAGRISETSPLATALLGARVGDVVTWHRPAGDTALTIDAIAYEEPRNRP